MAIVTSSNNSVGAGVDVETDDWQQILKRAIRDPRQLLDRLGLPRRMYDQLANDQTFSVFVPETFVDRMEAGNPRDPLLLQVLPRVAEDVESHGYGSDPVGDQTSLVAPGVIHKYEGRALLLVSGACGIHCRYCFRKQFPYVQNTISSMDAERWQRAIADDPTIEEVILSGGDPLMTADTKLANLVQRLEAIPHVRRLRIHTRLPIVVPQRVTQALLTTLTQSRMAVFVVVHANHPCEIDAIVGQSLEKMVGRGVPVLNQTVLLRDVNDDADILIGLSKRLIDHRVIPYYLHQLDRVSGTAHFEVSEDHGKAIMAKMRARLPGYAVPRYVREVPGECSKVSIA